MGCWSSPCRELRAHFWDDSPWLAMVGWLQFNSIGMWQTGEAHDPQSDPLEDRNTTWPFQKGIREKKSQHSGVSNTGLVFLVHRQELVWPLRVRAVVTKTSIYVTEHTVALSCYIYREQINDAKRCTLQLNIKSTYFRLIHYVFMKGNIGLGYLTPYISPGRYCECADLLKVSDNVNE